jgi:hypothetical protein
LRIGLAEAQPADNKTAGFMVSFGECAEESQGRALGLELFEQGGGADGNKLGLGLGRVHSRSDKMRRVAKRGGDTNQYACYRFFSRGRIVI